MQYTIDVYQKNAKKWGRINQMQESVKEILDEKRETEMQIEKLLNDVISTFTGNKEPLSINFHGDPLYIGNGGFYHIPSWRRTRTKLLPTIDLITFVTQPSVIKNFPARRETEKKTLLLLGKIVEEINKSQIKIVREVMKKFKRIDYYSEEIVETTATKISCEMDDTMRLNIYYEPKSKQSSEKDVITIEKGLANNILIEQLYLDLWRVLVKAIKRAKKQKAKYQKVLKKLQQGTSHILVAKEI